MDHPEDDVVTREKPCGCRCTVQRTWVDWDGRFEENVTVRLCTAHRARSVELRNGLQQLSEQEEAEVTTLETQIRRIRSEFEAQRKPLADESE